MGLEKKEIARFAVIDVTNGSVGNVYFEVHEVVEEDGVQIGGVNKRNVEATVQDVADFVGSATATLTEANQALHQQNTALQGQVADLTERLGAAVNALEKVAQADAAWDQTPRSEVTAVLQVERGE